MVVSFEVTQTPEPGRRICMYQGDTQTFVLRLASPQKGRAWIRTNIGHAATMRTEITRQVDHQESPLARDWFDIPMKRVSPRQYQITLGLGEVGHFAAKCYFLPHGRTEPTWPQGDNTILNVEPADTCCANTLYNAFVRQFGPNKAAGAADRRLDDEHIAALDRDGYTVIPPSGTFRQLILELDFIIEHLGCRILMLLPIHPTPTTYARMGRFGSPYAALSFTAVDPALAEFDPRATPLEQFLELVDAVHARQAKLFIDVAINHTGWAASLHETHPQWLMRDANGEIEAPGAWGVTWADLTRLNYAHKELWQYMADIFLTWCRRGVDGFRCDAGYMIPTPAWRYIIARVREQFPSTIFMLEGLGGKISVTRELLNTANFNWAYSELFQNYSRAQIEHYLPETKDISAADGPTIHFAETHDNNRLAARSHTYAQMRTALCALLSHQGAFAFANGVEWFATQKIDVHAAPSLNWGAPHNQVERIRRLNCLLAEHPAFCHPTRLTLCHRGEGNFVAVERLHTPSRKRLLVLANLEDAVGVQAHWDAQFGGLDGHRAFDLLTAAEVPLESTAGVRSCWLEPGQVLALSPEPPEPRPASTNERREPQAPRQIVMQRLRAKAVECVQALRGVYNLEPEEVTRIAAALAQDPAELCRTLNPSSAESRVTTWQWPQDQRREVMLPVGHFLLVKAAHPFRAVVSDPKKKALWAEASLPSQNGPHIMLVPPLPAPLVHTSLTLKISVFAPAGCRRVSAPLLLLAKPDRARVQTLFSRREVNGSALLHLGTNGRGGMQRAFARWGQVRSRYDALLAANLDPEIPEDRRILLTRCRAWLVCQGFSREINTDSLVNFGFHYQNGATWRYRIPTGQGKYVDLVIASDMLRDHNGIRISFRRLPARRHTNQLADHKPVTVIVRPDIEDRLFHDTTKAYTGPEKQWPAAVRARSRGFSFQPDPRHTLEMDAADGKFVSEPEWHYMVHRPMEAERGLEPHSDLFSPGYFALDLEGGKIEALVAFAGPPGATHPAPLAASPPAASGSACARGSAPKRMTLATALKAALNHYTVKRGPFTSVIAGYPWFLDWGRDTLIFARGMVAAGRLTETRKILQQFAGFEKDGTIPNMIRGNDASNRDTSDAPLWLFTVCADVMQAEGDARLLDLDCNGRSLRQILFAILDAVIAGTPNGIRMDPASALVFSPSHFSWMDTNHPACSPRQGYPIEIQALWLAALNLAATADPKSAWGDLAARVRRSIRQLFYLDAPGYLADCLHAEPGQAAHEATPDNALRPNQLLAITLGAVSDTALSRRILAACECLLVPGAIRSLADQPVWPPLEVMHQGALIYDPQNPYQGRYAGDEDTRRKPAYHNGTAWTWLFPSFCEAWVESYGPAARQTALCWLASSTRLINSGCVGHVPEVLDGDVPHLQRGCDAQAWGASELLRVWLKLGGTD